MNMLSVSDVHCPFKALFSVPLSLNSWCVFAGAAHVSEVWNSLVIVNKRPYLSALTNYYLMVYLICYWFSLLTQCSQLTWSVHGLCKNVFLWPAVDLFLFRFLLPKRGCTPHGLGKNSVLRVRFWPCLRGYVTLDKMYNLTILSSL